MTLRSAEINISAPKSITSVEISRDLRINSRLVTNNRRSLIRRVLSVLQLQLILVERNERGLQICLDATLIVNRTPLVWVQNNINVLDVSIVKNMNLVRSKLSTSLRGEQNNLW